ncbi:hypothetical protein [Desulfitobacterium sp. Sab5]|uniref:hypothetical protein n=1 Tax=Desulfitobacterium TaxID=36853 RepID=UPI003CF3A21F
MSLLGTPFRTFCGPTVPFILGLFDTFPIGTILLIGENSSFWRGSFGGLQDGVALLTNAQLFSNIGTPIDGIRPVVRIPIRQITFVSQ